uniref:Uncharacterized protein n=1 Tax=viral metagenome TaxID=1070528 RepID=A0A6M3LV02_9ZZZZ
MNEFEQKELYEKKACWSCYARNKTRNQIISLKQRKTKPATATNDGNKHYTYWQCPKCKANYAYPIHTNN